MHPGARLRLRRRIHGISAVLLPWDDAGGIDWAGFAAHVERTVRAGLTPAVNMDTGYVQRLGDADRERVLEVAKAHAGGGFVAGAHVADRGGDAWDEAAMLRQMERVHAHGGTPIVFPCHGLAALPEDEVVAAHERLGRHTDGLYAFELGRMFVPYGRIYTLDAFAGLVGIRRCLGAKHSSLSRQLEWERIALRDRERPDFGILTGNDLAIDMVIYGSDYLLGLSTFAPEAFARRDAWWAEGDPRFFELNDLLQYLGQLAFRRPVPAYRHSAAQLLRLRGWITSDATPPGAPRRPDSDLLLLAEIAERIDERTGG